MKNILLFLLIGLIACQQAEKPKTKIDPWVPYDESDEIASNADHPSSRMQYKLIQSKVNDKNGIWAVVQPQIQDFSAEEYERLKPLILEQDIPTIQASIKEGKLSYEKLTQWYLYRIVKFENDSTRTLHTIISINPKAVEQARQKDDSGEKGNHPIFGIPVLLKDNINTKNMKTTAGAVALKDHQPAEDAFIVKQIKAKGGIILGKLSLSEWANFICNGCPNGYSAVGGQTLNPYGRGRHDTGGSSSGSGTSMAANYGAVAVGTETSGSILSPSSSNSIVGLKPTIGVLSREGIVPISSTLDTPGPMTRNVTDNAILFSAMYGEDPKDQQTLGIKREDNFLAGLSEADVKGKRFGVMKAFFESDTLYQEAIQSLLSLGVDTVVVDPEGAQLPGFLELLRGDMKRDLKGYLATYASPGVAVRSVADVVEFNLQDSTIRAAYNQNIFKDIVKEEITDEELQATRDTLKQIGVSYFEGAMKANNLDAILSINNWSAGFAAVAKYPCLTVPMGYKEDGQPMGLTFIGRPYEEGKLLKFAYAFEKATKHRKLPEQFQ